MSDKTIPALPTISDLDDNSLFIVDSGTETFKVNGANLALFIREAVLPAGVTAPFAGAAAPAGWLLCDGSAVNRTTYARLFAVIGTAYGAGDGVLTFNLPDARGRVIAGKDNMGGSAANRLTTAVAGFDGGSLGASGGTQQTTPVGTIGGSQSIAHTHSFAHTHTFSHTHTFGHTHVWTHRGTRSTLYTKVASAPGTTSMSTSDHQVTASDIVTASGTESVMQGVNADLNTDYYTTGVVDAPSGSGTSATTSAASTSTTSAASTSVTGAMSTNATVNGSNFTFTGTAGHRVQPTLVMNQIIKT